MSDPLSIAARLFITALLLCAFTGAARAQEYYQPPERQAAERALAERDRQAAADALAERRQSMIERCEREHGTDCERETDTELRAEGLQSGARVIHLRPAAK
jgi:hypothetical protein